MNKLNTFALKMELNAKDKLNKFFRNTEGSVAAVLKTAMPDLFKEIMRIAQEKLTDIFN